MEPSCQGINKLFPPAYEGGDNRVTSDFHRRYFLPKEEV